jgi:hypothetical protein
MPECDFNTHECDLYTCKFDLQFVISHACEYNFDTHECNYDTHEYDFYRNEFNFNTLRVNLKLTN